MARGSHGIQSFFKVEFSFSLFFEDVQIVVDVHYSVSLNLAVVAMKGVFDLVMFYNFVVGLGP